ncbi:MAG: CHASE2 domain-containing protein, partial [Candidatus Omnitrophota bacterium]
MKAIKALIIALALTVGYMNFMMPLKGVTLANLKISDIFFSIAYKYRPLPLDIMNKMVLVTIDDESFKNMNLQWPWSRGVIAGMIKNISECSPRAICLDLMFAGKSPDENQDLIVSKAIMDAGNVFAGAYFGDDGRYITPEDVIAKSLKDFGFVDKPRDVDNFSRRAAPFLMTDPGNVRQYCLTIKLAGDLTGRTPEKIISGDRRLEKKNVYINFYGGMNKFLTIPAWKIFEADKAQLTEMIKGKTVFIGATSELIHDIYPTRMGLMSGVS